MSNQTVTLSNGAYSTSNPGYAGLSVYDIMHDDDVAAQCNLNGGESVRVRSAGSSVFESVDSDYVLELGDTVRFERTAGTKG